MAAVKLKENMDFDGKVIHQHVKSYLPSYARPRFIRIQVNLVSEHKVKNWNFQLKIPRMFLLKKIGRMA